MIKRNAKQMLPVALIIGITIIMSLFLYQRVMVKETEICWELLADSARSVTSEMQITFSSDIDVLHLAADTIELDGLTSLYNRNKYIQLLAAHRHQILKNVGSIYLDLNRLKTVNDQKGHEAGDALICAAARTIGKIYPNQAYRIGGDEFVVLVLGIYQKHI